MAWFESIHILLSIKLHVELATNKKIDIFGIDATRQQLINQFNKEF